MLSIISGRPFHQDFTSDSCITMIKSWIKDCLENHGTSCPSVQETLPTRVIDVGNSSREPCLYITNGQIGTWVSLSHCWGKDTPFVTDSQNVAERRSKIVITTMPKTIRDAILITRKLGYRYLWIDSLCILQDSMIDWAIESSQMQHYYKRSILTIAADSAASDNEGFLTDQRQKEIARIKIPFNTKLTSNLTYAFIGEKIKSFREISQEETHLKRRAWTLQEDLLSPRTIHYTDDQMVWECQKYTRTESDDTPLGTNDADLSLLFKRYFLNPSCAAEDSLVLSYPSYSQFYTPMNRWYKILENYSNRLLTFEDDRFNAISGIAKEMQQQTNLTYKGGIWMEDFHKGLLWCLDGRGVPPSVYRAPSWSWASMDVHKFWGTYVGPEFELYSRMENWEVDPDCVKCQLLECTLELATEDPFGRLLSGVLRLRGRWMSYSHWKTGTPIYYNSYWYAAKSHIHWTYRQWGLHKPDSKDQLICSFDHEPENLNIDDALKNDSVSTEEEEEEEEEIGYTWDEEILRSASFFQIGRYISSGDTSIIHSLILLPAGDNDTFRRAGIAEVPDVIELGEGWEVRDINII